MKHNSWHSALIFAALALAGVSHAQTDRIQASVSLATINDILEKFRATKGLDQSGYQNLGSVLPVTYSATIKKFGLTLDAPNNGAILTTDLNLASNFDFPGWTYKYNEDYRFVVKGTLNISKSDAGKSAGSIQLCPTASSIAPPVIYCLASGSPVSCAIKTEVVDVVNKVIDNTKCLDLTGLGKVLPSIDMAVVNSSEPIMVYPDKIGFGYTIKPYKIPFNMTPIIALLLL